MKRYLIKKGGVFYTPHPEIKIYDSRGVLFYDSNDVENFDKKISIPAISLGDGAITSTAPLYKIGNLKKYPYNVLRPIEHNFGHNWDDFKIQFEINLRKCSIFHNEKRIVFDLSYLYRPYNELCFILFHEVGHNYYNTEVYADEFSALTMLNKGFTPFQILNAVLTLSEKNDYRKVAIVEFLKKVLK